MALIVPEGLIEIDVVSGQSRADVNRLPFVVSNDCAGRQSAESY